jgi:DNA-binding transcriptional regulator YhcF (GntR family)
MASYVRQAVHDSLPSHSISFAAMSLDPNDPRPPYVQVASALRAAILTKTLEPGDQLPSGSQLAKRYGVARMTVQQAIRVLRDEGLVVSRQGSGVFVRDRTARPVSLRPVVERAFQRPQVLVDFFGFTAETLLGAVQEPLDKIRSGGPAPESIAIRILAPDTSQPLPLPCRVDDLADDPDFRERSRAMTQRHTQAIADAVSELDELGLVRRGSVEFRVHRLVPLFKTYILNREELFLGLYPVVRRRLDLNHEPHDIYDLMGKDALLFHHAITDDDTSTGSQYVEHVQGWFDTIWTTVARETTR